MSEAAIHPAARRGRALLLLGGIPLAWLLVRAVTWQAPFLPASFGELQTDMSSAPLRTVRELTDLLTPENRAESEVGYAPAGLNSLVVYSGIGPKLALPSARGFALPAALTADPSSITPAITGAADTPSDQNREFSQQAWPVALPAPNVTPRAAETVRETKAPSRWTMDAWAMWRQDSASPVLSGRPSYGRSQAGAAVRYALAPSSGHAPQVYVRASSALKAQQEREIALGASVRPLSGIPVRVAAEARISETDRGTEPRAAIYAVSEFPPLALPGGLTAETYVQAGYVAGDFATPFVDGQTRITRDLATKGDFRLSAGVGAWGGAQDDAQRLDVGPTAGINFRVGAARARISADYRFGVAGDAQPSSGPALTLSAGF